MFFSYLNFIHSPPRLSKIHKKVFYLFIFQTLLLRQSCISRKPEKHMLYCLRHKQVVDATAQLFKAAVYKNVKQLAHRGVFDGSA